MVAGAIQRRHPLILAVPASYTRGLLDSLPDRLTATKSAEVTSISGSAGVLLERRQEGGEVLEHAFGEAGADAAHMLQVAVLVTDGKDAPMPSSGGF
jgi:hypothetical protein